MYYFACTSICVSYIAIKPPTSLARPPMFLLLTAVAGVARTKVRVISRSIFLVHPYYIMWHYQFVAARQHGFTEPE